jgi:hypothetical protein
MRPPPLPPGLPARRLRRFRADAAWPACGRGVGVLRWIFVSRQGDIELSSNFRKRFIFLEFASARASIDSVLAPAQNEVPS